jgi:K(+)-stimulated pyrophosphate-energized sodium pump
LYWPPVGYCARAELQRWDASRPYRSRDENNVAVTSLGLILGINCAGLVCAALLARWVLGRDAGSSEMRRVAGAVRRAMRALLWQEFRLVALGLAVLTVAVAALHGTVVPAGATLGALEAAFWTVAGLAVGAASGCLAAYAAAELALGATLRTLAALRASTDRAVAIAVRAGGAAGLLVEATSVIGVCALMAVPFAINGGFSLASAQAAPLALGLANLLPSYGLGAATAALVVHQGSSVYRCAGRLSAELAGDCRAGLAQDDPRNPAIVAELVGEQLGGAASRAVDLFLSATVANIAAGIVGAALYFTNHERLPALLGLAAFPAAVRAFGIIASGCGVLVVRSDELQPPARALWRGQATASTVALGGLLGAAVWLAGEVRWGALVAAGAVGIAAPIAAAHAMRLRLDRRFAPMRELLESLRHTSPSAATQGLAVGLQATAVPMLVMSIAGVVAWQLGSATGLPGGGIITTLTALMAMLASGPYLLATSTFGPIAESARAVAAMGASAGAAELQRRTQRLHDAGLAASTVAHTYLSIVGTLAALLAALALSLLATVHDSNCAGLVDIGKPAVLWSGALGAAAVLLYAGSVARTALRGTRGVAAEIERQLRGFPRSGGVPQLPRDYTPSYRGCIDSAARAALHRLPAATATVLLAPVGLALALLLLSGSMHAPLAREALASFVSVAAVVALAAALTADPTQAALSATRRVDATHTDPATLAAAASANTLAGVMGYCVGPAAHLLVRATAIVALAVAPFLI